jgi:hypothetical protein
MQSMENSIANKSHAAVNAKLKGILKKMKSFQFLTIACLYKEILDIISVLSLMFEQQNIFVFDVLSHLEQTKSKLQELKEENGCCWDCL